MARYTDKEIKLLHFSWIDSDDDDPPWTHSKVNWKGKSIPFCNGVDIKSRGADRPEVTIYVASYNERGYYKDNEDWTKLFDDMLKYDVKVVGYPNNFKPYKTKKK